MTKRKAKGPGLPTHSTKSILNSGDLRTFVRRVREILDAARNRALQTVNAEMVRSYWEIGREIMEEEQRGRNRAGYGDELIGNLSRELIRDYGKGFSPRNLLYIRNFYVAYPKSQALLAKLSWTHYRLLSEIEKPAAREFYEKECVRAGWSTRELERQNHSLLYERLLRTKDKRAGLQGLESKKTEKFQPRDIIRDPYVLEFTGLPESTNHLESDLENALVDKLQHFLLELGKGFAFLGRQQRITVDGDHFYVDLVFYHTILKCFVLIDLKAAKITHADLGQMQFYVNYTQRGHNLSFLTRLFGCDFVRLEKCPRRPGREPKFTAKMKTDPAFAWSIEIYAPTERPGYPNVVGTVVYRPNAPSGTPPVRVLFHPEFLSTYQRRE